MTPKPTKIIVSYELTDVLVIPVAVLGKSTFYEVLSNLLLSFC